MAFSDFQSGNDFGQALLELVDTEYDSAEDALADIMDATGMDENECLDLLEGSAVADADLVEALIQVFDTTSSDADAADGFMALAEDAYLDAMEANEESEAYEEDEYEDEEEEGDEDDYEEEDEDDEDNSSNYSRRDNLGILGDIGQVQDSIAEFQMRDAINEELDYLEAYAEQGIEQGWLSSGIKRVILGEFKKDSQRIAQFSGVCEKNSVDAATQLYGIEYALKILETLGPLDLLNSYADEEIEEAQFSAGEEQILDAQAEGALLLYKARRNG